MTYGEYRDTIRSALEAQPKGLTWVELRELRGLPYVRPCPEWTRRLERDIGLERKKRRGNALVWKLR